MSVEDQASSVVEQIDRELRDKYDEDAFIRRLGERISAERRRSATARAGGLRPGRPQGAAGPAPDASAPTSRATARWPAPQLMPAACRADLRLQLKKLCEQIVVGAACRRGGEFDDVNAVVVGCVLYSQGSEAWAEWWWQLAAAAESDLAPHLLSVLLAATCRENEAGQWRLHAEAVGLTVPASAGPAHDRSVEVLLSDEVSEEAVQDVVEQWPTRSPIPKTSWLAPGRSVFPDPVQPALLPRVLKGRSLRRRTPSSVASQRTGPSAQAAATPASSASASHQPPEARERRARTTGGRPRSSVVDGPAAEPATRGPGSFGPIVRPWPVSAQLSGPPASPSPPSGPETASD